MPYIFCIKCGGKLFLFTLYECSRPTVVGGRLCQFPFLDSGPPL
nr:MAG TPA: HTH-type transcriptional regulator [Caudoviricetes sp.]